MIDFNSNGDVIYVFTVKFEGVMDQRYIVAALARMFAVALIFATITTVRHIGQVEQETAPIKSKHRPNPLAGRPV